jgi:hypothetical protein
LSASQHQHERKGKHPCLIFLLLYNYGLKCRLYQGKVVIITGSGQGLGKAFAAGLLDQGAKVDGFLK